MHMSFGLLGLDSCGQPTHSAQKAPAMHQVELVTVQIAQRVAGSVDAHLVARNAELKESDPFVVQKLHVLRRVFFQNQRSARASSRNSGR